MVTRESWGEAGRGGQAKKFFRLLASPQLRPQLSRVLIFSLLSWRTIRKIGTASSLRYPTVVRIANKTICKA